MALVKDYFEKTKQYKQEYGEKTIVLMQVGSFFEVYGIQDPETKIISGSNICEFSKICDFNIAEKNICIGKQNVLMAGFSLPMIDKYLKKLQEANYTIVVYTQDEQAKNTTRSLAGIFSPGTYFSLDSDKITNNILCIWVHCIDMKSSSSLLKKILNSGKCQTESNKMIYIGIANINIYTGESSIFEFCENYIKNPTTFDELERFASIYKPSEVIIVGNIPEEEMNLVLNYSNIMCNSYHCISLHETVKNSRANFVKQAINCEKQVYQKEVLNKFFPDKYLNSDHYDEFYKKIYATHAYCFLLDFVYQHNPHLVSKIKEPVFQNCSERLVLANHSLKQLNIIDDDNDYNGKYSSVEKMLNHCITSMGKRKFSHLFLNPTTNSQYLQKEYDIIEHVLDFYKGNVESSEGLEKIRQMMKDIKDINKINRQIIMKKISPKTLYQVWKNVKTIQEIYEFLKIDKNLMKYLNNNNISLHCQILIDFFDKNLNMELCSFVDNNQQFDINFINKGVNSELDDNDNLLNDSFCILNSILLFFNENIGKTEKPKSKSISKEKSTDFVKLHETEKNSFSLIATKRRCVILKECIKNQPINNIVNLEYKDCNQKSKKYELKFCKDSITFANQSTSNDSIVSSQINILCKNITTIKLKLKDILSNVYNEILNKLEKYQTEIESIIEFISSIDVLFSKALIVKKYNYCKPEICFNYEKSFVEAHGLRHCIIEKIQCSEIYVTNDICLGKSDSDCKKDGILLYGTNAVGKTSLIRALGIAVIMAQAGLYVPCSNFKFKPYKYIFTRIIGNDNIFKGLSTFAVEMSELRTILRLATQDSLILGDELCSGTESISAQSIFVAGIKQLCSKKSSFIFATHLHEIVDYDEIKNLSDQVSLNHMEVIYNKERDILIYDRKLKDGPGTNMYGLEVCRSLNLPDDFLELANQIRMKYHPENSSILGKKTSHFNSKKVMGNCEKCGAIGSEVHHLQHQSEADQNGFIRKPDGTVFHKNHPANLMTLCESCHHNMHYDIPDEKYEKNMKNMKKSKNNKIIK